jgi:iron complex outermembrane receptor protein
VQSIQDYDSASPLASPNFIRAKDRQAVAGRYPTDVTQKFDQYYWQAQLNLKGQRLTYVGLRSNQLLDGINPQDNAGLFANQIAPKSYFAGVNPVTGGIIGIPTGQSGPYALHSVTTSKNTSHEIRLQNDTRIADMFDYVIGYMQYDTGSDTDFDRTVGVIATPLPPLMPTTIAQIYSVPLVRYIDEKEQSVFGNLTVHLGEGTELSGGLRHIWYETISGLKAFGVDDPDLRQDFDTSATIWTASAKHRVNENLMVYASAGSSWRPNTVVIGGPVNASPFQLQFQGTPAEKSKSYELGLKSSWLDNRLRFNVTGFYQDFKNYPYRSLVGPWSIVPDSYNPADLTQLRVEQVEYAAAVPVTVKGMEAEVSFTPVPNVNLGAMFSYALGKIKNGTVPCTDINQDGVDDLLTSQPDAQDLFGATGTDFLSACQVTQRSAASAPWSGALTAEYTHPISDSMDGYLRGLYSWKGKSQGDPQSAIDSVKAYGILNVYAGLRHPDGNWEFSLYAKNLTNTFRVVSNQGLRSTSTLSHGTLSYTNYYGITVTEPREFGINARFAFGSR